MYAPKIDPRLELNFFLPLETFTENQLGTFECKIDKWNKTFKKIIELNFLKSTLVYKENAASFLKRIYERLYTWNGGLVACVNNLWNILQNAHTNPEHKEMVYLFIGLCIWKIDFWEINTISQKNEISYNKLWYPCIFPKLDFGEYTREIKQKMQK